MENNYHLCVLHETTTDQWATMEATYMTKEQYERIKQVLAELALKPSKPTAEDDTGTA